MKTTEEKIAVMQAFLDRKTIEYYDEDLKIWLDLVVPCWNWEKWEYRIKLKYQPFDFSDAENLIGKVVKTKNNDFISLINCAYIDNNFISVGNTRIGYDKLLSDFTFLDGSICGKLKQ